MSFHKLIQGYPTATPTNQYLNEANCPRLYSRRDSLSFERTLERPLERTLERTLEGTLARTLARTLERTLKKALEKA